MHRDLQSRMDEHAQRDDIVRQNLDETRREQTRSIEINEAGFQAVKFALVAGHESTHAMLSQMQRLGNHLAFRASKNSVRSPRMPSDEWGSLTPMTTVYWKTLYHNLPIGKLRISIDQTRHCKGSTDSSSLESTESSISVTFVPPKWLTCLAVDYKMKLSHNFIGDQWHWGAHLRPLTVNQNPFVINALETLDLGAIKESFSEGLIHPTDCVLDGTYVKPWYWVRLSHTFIYDVLKSSISY